MAAEDFRAGERAYFACEVVVVSRCRKTGFQDVESVCLGGEIEVPFHEFDGERFIRWVVEVGVADAVFVSEQLRWE